jgi:hypothetical protein
MTRGVWITRFDGLDHHLQLLSYIQLELFVRAIEFFVEILETVELSISVSNQDQRQEYG